MSGLSTQNYKGARDYFPSDKRLQNYIFSVWAKTVESFGYEEYGAPILEPLEIYAAKSGQELVNEQTYVFDDRGGRTVVVRPEMTPSIARMVASKRQELPMPARLYSIANFMRYERPQRGREREFWQLNADLFGVDTPTADSEIIELSYNSVMNFGASLDMFTIKINHRQLINQWMHDFLQLDDNQAKLMAKLLDRMKKIPTEAFNQQATEIFGDNSDEGMAKLSELLKVQTVKDLPGKLCCTPAGKQLSEVLKSLEEKGIDNAVFDVTLMRGLDYYTGTVFEFFDNSPENNRSLFGGGRYDGLVELFGVEPLSTVGVGLGATTMQQFLQVHNLLPELCSLTDVYMIIVDESSVSGANNLAGLLRKSSINVEIDITNRKVDKKIKTATKKQIPFVIFIGENELKTEKYTLKNLTNSDEQKLNIEELISTLKNNQQ